MSSIEEICSFKDIGSYCLEGNVFNITCRCGESFYLCTGHCDKVVREISSIYTKVLSKKGDTAKAPLERACTYTCHQKLLNIFQGFGLSHLITSSCNGKLTVSDKCIYAKRRNKKNKSQIIINKKNEKPWGTFPHANEASDGIPPEAPTTQKPNYKTMMCRYGQNCIFGERCSYAHSAAELRTFPTYINEESTTSTNTPINNSASVPVTLAIISEDIPPKPFILKPSDFPDLPSSKLKEEKDDDNYNLSGSETDTNTSTSTTEYQASESTVDSSTTANLYGNHTNSNSNGSINNSNNNPQIWLGRNHGFDNIGSHIGGINDSIKTEGYESSSTLNYSASTPSSTWPLGLGYLISTASASASATNSSLDTSLHASTLLNNNNTAAANNNNNISANGDSNGMPSLTALGTGTGTGSIVVNDSSGLNHYSSSSNNVLFMNTSSSSTSNNSQDHPLPPSSLSSLLGGGGSSDNTTSITSTSSTPPPPWSFFNYELTTPSLSLLLQQSTPPHVLSSSTSTQSLLTQIQAQPQTQSLASTNNNVGIDADIVPSKTFPTVEWMRKYDMAMYLWSGNERAWTEFAMHIPPHCIYFLSQHMHILTQESNCSMHMDHDYLSGSYETFLVMKRGEDGDPANATMTKALQLISTYFAEIFSHSTTPPDKQQLEENNTNRTSSLGTLTF